MRKNILKNMAQKITLSVTKKEQLNKNIYVVTFKLVSPPTITFTSGQNMMLMIGPGVNRTMSIASPPSSNTELVMVHDISPMGPGSKWTIGLKVGDAAIVVAPTGGALSFIDSPRKKVMVATGTGVAPFRSMILDARYQNIVLYWGLRHEDDIYWKEEFENRLPFHLILSQPTESWQGLKGHVTEHVIANEFKTPGRSPFGHLPGDQIEFYLCGNKAMIEDVRAKLLEQNVPQEQIKSELFF